MAGLHSRNSSVQSTSTTASSIGNVQLASIMQHQDRRVRASSGQEVARSVAFEVPLDSLLPSREHRRSKRISRENSKLRKAKPDIEARPRRTSTDRRSSQGVCYTYSIYATRTDSSAGSMKELPPLPLSLHVQNRRVSSGSTASAASLLPRLDLGAFSLDISQELLSPDSSLADDLDRTLSPVLAGKSSCRSRTSDPLQPADGDRSSRSSGERYARREARRSTALWVAMLGNMDNFGASSNQQVHLAVHGQATSPLLSPAASSDCLDPFFPPLPAASSSSMGRKATLANLAVPGSANLDKPLPPSPRLRSPSEPSPHSSGRFDGPKAQIALIARAPRRASLPNASTSQLPPSSHSSSKRRPPLSNLLTPIPDVDEGPASAPLSYPSQRSLSLPGQTSDGSLPTLSSTQTITPSGYQSRYQQRRYRFPSASSAGDSESADLTPMSSTFPESLEMSRDREHSFSSISGGSAGFYSSDGERSRRSSNFTADSSVPSPRTPGFEEGPDSVTPKLASEAFAPNDEGKNRKHLRIDSTASRQLANGTSGLKRSPTMEIVMYGMAM